MIAVAFILLAYTLLVATYYGAWKKIKPPVVNASCHALITVVVAVRNEELKVAALIRSLAAQTIPVGNFEVIIVNDHSTDATVNVALQHLQKTTLNYKLINLPEANEGKKAAIALGVSHASGTLIATTDGDCEVPVSWLSTIGSHYANNKPSMMLMPVALTGSSFIAQMQAMEFVSLTGVTGASLLLKKPMMCNGANLAFEKSVYEKIPRDFFKPAIPSGDDAFFMLHIFHQLALKVDYLQSTDVVVKTEAQKTVAAFLQQRIRWTAKLTGYDQRYITLIGWLVLLSSLSVWAVACYLPFAPLTLKIVLLMCVSGKLLADLFFIKKVAKDTAQKFSPSAFICWQFAYAVYVLVVTAAALFNCFTWKGRKYD